MPRPSLTLTTPLALACAISSACAISPGWNNDDALAAHSVEVALDGHARPTTVEYHVSPADVPANVLDAMDALHPGGEAVAAEKEFVGSTVYWEVTKEIDGREIEAMFQQNGKLHSEEIQISADRVPENVQAAVQARLDGQITQWEEIRDGKQMLVEYHAKTTVEGKKYKLRVSADGKVLSVVREVPAEIEVPVP